MRRLLNLFPVDAHDADRAASEIRSLFHWPDFLAATGYAALLTIVLPATLLGIIMVGGAL